MINHPFLKLIKSAQTIDSAATLVLIGSEANRSMYAKTLSKPAREGWGFTSVSSDSSQCQDIFSAANLPR